MGTSLHGSAVHSAGMKSIIFFRFWPVTRTIAQIARRAAEREKPTTITKESRQQMFDREKTKQQATNIFENDTAEDCKRRIIQKGPDFAALKGRPCTQT